MQAELEIPRFFGSPQAPGWFRSWREAAGAPTLTLRLPADAFIEPSGIALLAAGIADRTSRGLETALHAPESETRSYLQRMDFFAVLGVKLPENFVRGPEKGRFVPLRRIEDLKTATRLALETASVLEEQLPRAAPSHIRAARFVFEELAANIVQHSGRPETGFGIAQAYSQAKRLRIAFADCGIGFLRSLERNPELAGRIADDSEAITIAVEKGVSGADGRSNLGIGLPLLREVADRLDAELWIASGSALWHRRTVARERVSTTRLIDPWQGAWIAFDGSIPLAEPAATNVAG